MSDWQISNRTIAKPVGLTISARRVLDGVEVTLNLSLSTLGWQETEQRVDIVPRSVDAELRLAGGDVQLGKLAAQPTTISLASHGWDATASFMLTLSPAQLRLIEIRRGGLPMTFFGSFWAEVYLEGARQQIVSCLQYASALDRDAWLATLRDVGYFDSIAVEIPLYAALPPDLADARMLIEHANEARQRGARGHVDAVAECRKALNAIEQAGFGSKAPKDVIAFIAENAAKLSLMERTGVLQAALKLYFSPAHHAGSGAKEMNHLDSSFALAATASLLQLVARNRPPAREDENR
jgi:hypothetical protein